VRDDDIFSADAGLRGDFRTGAVGHTVTLSASTISIESDNAYAFSSFAGFAGDLYEPQDVAPPTPDFFVGGDLSAPGKTEDTRNRSLALADMVSLLDDRLLLTAGLRYQEIETKTYDYDTGAELSRYDESRVTPVAGAVVRFGDQVSVYGNYAEGLIPGETAPATSGGVPIVNAGETFDPYRAEQYELGIKYDGGNLGASVALFSLSRPSSLVEDNVFTADGEQRNRGLELNAFGEPLPGFRVLGGLTWLEAELTETQGDVNEGNDAVGVPELQANLNLEWDLPAVPGLTLDGRLIYTGEQYADAANAVAVDDWTRLDLGVRYDTRLFGRSTALRARLENVTDEDYWASVGGFPGSNYLVLGAPRTLLVSASVDL
jgi:iron complex outermembrane receptor protein